MGPFIVRRFGAKMRQRRFTAGSPGVLNDGRVPAAVAAYGLRLLDERYAGPLVRLREDSGDTLADFYLVGGVLRNESGQTVAAWLTANSATNAYVRTWYDQSGNGVDASQATAANQPRFLATGSTSFPTLPAVECTTADNPLLENTSPPITGAPFTVVTVAASHLAAAVGGPWGLSDASDFTQRYILYYSGHVGGDPVQAIASDGTSGTASTSTGFTADTPCTATYVEAAADSRSVYINNGSVGTNGTSVTPSGIDRLGIGGHRTQFGPTDEFDGDIAEVLFFASDIGATARAALQASQSAYYGIS